MTPTLRTALLASVVAAAAGVALAQTTTSPSTAASAQPDAVGVSSQTAAEANARAVPRSDTATVVRTGPSATDRAADASDRVKARVGDDNRSTSGSMNTTGTATGDTMTTTGSDATLTPRADRN